MKTILLGNGTKEGVLEAVAMLRPEIERKVEVVASDFYGNDDFSNVKADLAIVFGGDGSVLRAVAQLGTNQIPVIAVHFGTLSFLSTIRANELIALLERSDLQNLSVTKHLLLDCKLYRNENKDEPEFSRFVLNEITIQGETAGRIMGIELSIDGELVTTYRGDGLILSTPIGSTAHNLSAGGPILRNDIDAVVLSPLNPHTLSNRPLVDSPQRCFEIRLQQKGLLILDGSVIETIYPGDTVRATKADQTFKTLDVPGYCYYRTLRNKLGWNGSFTEDV